MSAAKEDYALLVKPTAGSKTTVPILQYLDHSLYVIKSPLAIHVSQRLRSLDVKLKHIKVCA